MAKVGWEMRLKTRAGAPKGPFFVCFLCGEDGLGSVSSFYPFCLCVCVCGEDGEDGDLGAGDGDEVGGA